MDYCSLSFELGASFSRSNSPLVNKTSDSGMKGCLLLVCGRLADLYGRKKAYLIGTLIFAGFSLGCAFANSTPFFLCFLPSDTSLLTSAVLLDIITLIILRGVQGIGAAATIPASVSLCLLGDLWSTENLPLFAFSLQTTLTNYHSSPRFFVSSHSNSQSILFSHLVKSTTHRTVRNPRKFIPPFQSTFTCIRHIRSGRTRRCSIRIRNWWRIN